MRKTQTEVVPEENTSDTPITQPAGVSVDDVFLPEELDVRAMQHTKDGTKAVPFFYLTARAVMNRLDDVYGKMGWTSISELVSANDWKVVYKVSIIVGDLRRDGIGEADVMWRTNKDGSTAISNDVHKSAESDAFKRAAVALGIGRYLYMVPQLWLPWEEDSYEKRQWGHFADDPRDIIFNEDGTIRADAMAKDTRQQKSKPAKTTTTAPRTSRGATTSAEVPLTPRASRGAAGPAPDVESESAAPTRSALPSRADTPVAKALAARRGAAPVAVTEPEPAPKGQGSNEQISEYFLAFAKERGIEIDPFENEAEVYEDVTNICAQSQASFMTAKQLGFIISLCDDLEVDYPENLFSLTGKEASPIIQGLMKAKNQKK